MVSHILFATPLCVTGEPHSNLLGDQKLIRNGPVVVVELGQPPGLFSLEKPERVFAGYERGALRYRPENRLNRLQCTSP